MQDLINVEAPEIIIASVLDAEAKIRDIDAQIKALQSEKKELDIRVSEGKESLREFNGHSFGIFKISLKAGDSLIMNKDAIIPEQFQRIKIEPDKMGLKKAIKAGQVFEGFSIEINYHVQIDLV